MPITYKPKQVNWKPSVANFPSATQRPAGMGKTEHLTPKHGPRGQPKGS